MRLAEVHSQGLDNHSVTRLDAMTSPPSYDPLISHLPIAGICLRPTTVLNWETVFWTGKKGRGKKSMLIGLCLWQKKVFSYFKTSISNLRTEPCQHLRTYPHDWKDLKEKPKWPKRKNKENVPLITLRFLCRVVVFWRQHTRHHTRNVYQIHTKIMSETRCLMTAENPKAPFDNFI